MAHVLAVEKLASTCPAFAAGLQQRARASSVVRVPGSELRALRYAFAPPRYVPRPNCRAFFLSSDVAQMAWMFVLIAAVESIALHILAASIGGLITATVVILGDVLIVYSVGIARSVGAIPIEVEEDQVRVRIGILFDGEVSRGNLTVSTPFATGVKHRGGCLNGALLSSPNMFLRLTHPVDIKVFGLFHKRVDCMKLKVAEPEAFAASIAGPPNNAESRSFSAVGATA